MSLSIAKGRIAGLHPTIGLGYPKFRVLYSNSMPYAVSPWENWGWGGDNADLWLLLLLDELSCALAPKSYKLCWSTRRLNLTPIVLVPHSWY